MQRVDIGVIPNFDVRPVRLVFGPHQRLDAALGNEVRPARALRLQRLIADRVSGGPAAGQVHDDIREGNHGCQAVGGRVGRSPERFCQLAQRRIRRVVVMQDGRDADFAVVMQGDTRLLASERVPAAGECGARCLGERADSGATAR